MLLGREQERQAIERLLEAARRGAGGALLVLGEPGVGKSALLCYAAERAAGMALVRARGLESEAELAFAGLSELLRPLLCRLPALSAAQRSGLEGALALGEASPADRFVAYAATLSLLAAAAEHEPLVVLVDDAHWLDSSSLAALCFTARRLGADRIAILFAARAGEQQDLEASGLPELRLAGLAAQAAAGLLARAADGEIAAQVTARLIAGSAGNPLALVELPRLLSAAQLRGQEPLPEPLPLGPGLEPAFRRRIEALPAATGRALVVAAASDGALAQIAAALAALALSVRALEPAEADGLVEIAAGRLEFRHPLLRSAAYQRASANERRQAHAALAEALRGERTAARRAWHLAAAALSPDEQVAGALEQAAQEARGRGAPGEAGRTLAAAARLTPEPQRRARRRLAAGQSLNLAGRPDEAAALLEQAVGDTEDPRLHAEIQHLRGQIEMFSGSATAARQLLLSEAAAIEARDPAKAVLILADGAGTLLMDGRVYEVREAAERMYRLAEPLGGIPAQASELVMAQALTLSGETSQALASMRRGESLLEGGGLAEKAWLSAGIAHFISWLEQTDDARDMISGFIDEARTASAVGLLPWPLAVLCNIEFRRGDWAAAYAAGSESVRLAEETGQRNEISISLVWLGRLEAARGIERECRAHLERALDTAALTGGDSIRHVANAALGLLELGLGRTDEAIRRLEVTECFERDQGLRQPTVAQAAPDLIEAYARAGRLSDAESTLQDLERQADETQGRWAAAVAARCRGLLADEQHFERDFEQALSLHEQVPQPFERARTELCFGERLRRARRRSHARDQLRAALASFERLGAVPWAEKARRELAASGERLERAASRGRDQLTPAELQVALAVATGASNQEVAAALFVSRRTVEAHLNRIYRKLAIRSRSELTRLVLEGRLPGEAVTIAGA